MSFTKTSIEGLLIFEPKIFKDTRGFFFESFNKKNFLSADIHTEFVQDNQAYSQYGVVRGLHFQNGSDCQAKLVTVLQGAVLDVVVDLRQHSATFGKVFSIELNSENKLQLFVPRGFAHGYAVLSETALFYYKCDNYYNPSAEGAININDPSLNIDWKVPKEKMLISDKDKLAPNFDSKKHYF
jgi:dTDP-4-dehydrorhamnose 3,5-epimerase